MFHLIKITRKVNFPALLPSSLKRVGSVRELAPWTALPQSGRVVKFTAVSSWRSKSAEPFSGCHQSPTIAFVCGCGECACFNFRLRARVVGIVAVAMAKVSFLGWKDWTVWIVALFCRIELIEYFDEGIKIVMQMQFRGRVKIYLERDLNDWFKINWFSFKLFFFNNRFLTLSQPFYYIFLN